MPSVCQKETLDIVSMLPHHPRLYSYCSASTTSNASFSQSNKERAQICATRREAEMERRWSHGPRRWLPPDDSCAVWRYIRADRGHLFPIIQGKMRNWVGNRTRRRCQGAWPEPSSRFVPLEINGQRWLFRKPEQQWKDNVHNEEIAAVRLVMTVNIFTTSARDGGRTETEMRDDVSCSCGSI